MTDAPRSEHPHAVRWCCAAVFAFAFVWFWPTLAHGLRTDDYLAIYYCDRLTGAVHWDRVFDEFTRPWFGTGELYRPLISLGYALESALWPSPVVRHAVNVACIAATAAATAATAALLAPNWRVGAAVVAGAIVVMHPATVEPAAWISARVTSQQVALCMLACWLFTRHVVHGAARWPAVVAFVLALGSKEAAVVLPVTLLALAWLHAPQQPWRARLTLLVPFVIVLAAYLAWRIWVLGRIGPVKEGASLPANLANVVTRVAQLVAPPGDGGGFRGWLAALALVPLLAQRSRLGRAALLVPVWWFVVLAPTQHLPATFADLSGRFVFDAVPLLAIVAGIGVGIARANVWFAVAGAVAVWTAALVPASRGWLGQYEREDALARGTERALAAAAAAATPAQPFACSGLPYLPVFHQQLWGVLGLVPFAPRDLAVIGLPELLVPDERFPEFRYDAAPVHAVLAAGGTVAGLKHDTLQFVPMPAPTPVTLTLRASDTAPREFVAAPGAWPGGAPAAIELKLPRPAREARWRLLDDLPTEHALGWRVHVPAPPPAATWLATSHALAPVLLHGLGVPFRGVHVEIDGGDPPAGTELVLHATLPMRDLATRVAGAERARDWLYALPESPPTPEPQRLYVMLPTGVRHMDVPAGGAPMTVPLREHLRWSLDLFAPLTVHWFWQALPDTNATPWRSELDWASAR